MRTRKSIFYSALMLTLVNLLLRAVGTSFQVYLSGRIGAAGIGLLQMVMSVGSLAMVAGIAGIRTATMYLTAEELGKKQPKNVGHILSGCFLYSIFCSGAVALLIYVFAPTIAQLWIGDIRTVHALRLFAAFLPCTCLCGVMTGYFTAANRIGTLAAVEVAEQLASMGCTLCLLHFWAGSDAVKACLCVIFGSSLGACVTLVSLIILRWREKPSHGPKLPVARRLAQTAIPLALADVLKVGINTAENLMVPKRLALNTFVNNPLAAFGTVSGMVFPVLMFPACILFGLAELLIPELARCASAGSRQRISYLVQRSLKVTLLYGILFCGLLYLLADILCMTLYGSEEAGYYLRLYSLLIPMLYCDAITDAMIKGLGQQKKSVQYNIFTSVLDLAFLYLLLPHYGMMGYFFSFLVTHLINFLLSLCRLLKITGERIPLSLPFFALLSVIVSIEILQFLSAPAAQTLLYPVILGCLLYLLGVISREDFRWIKTLAAKNDLSKDRSFLFL